MNNQIEDIPPDLAQNSFRARVIWCERLNDNYVFRYGIGIWIICAVWFVGINTASANEGETIFKSQGCMLCHKTESASKVNPSLTEIATVYQGKEEQLIKYLQGEAEAIVKPEKASLMKRHIEKTKKLSDTDRKALADYLLRQQ